MAATRDADEALVALYTLHYRRLVRLATLLLHDPGAAEEVVQDAFVALHGRWHRLRDAERADAYLRQAVVNGARSRLRHLKVVDAHRPLPPTAPAGPEQVAVAHAERDEVMRALRRLPTRQREALVLRYYGDLSEAEIADAMRISVGAVKSHTARGMAALRTTLERPS
jgi:RNA polymerase sigma-70 factor (sigma-E family)